MTARHILASHRARGLVSRFLKIRSPEVYVHASRDYVSYDQTRSRRIHNFDRCGKDGFAKLPIIPVIDVNGGIAVERGRELSLLQEQAAVPVEEEPLATILAGYWNYVGILSVDSVQENGPRRFDCTELVGCKNFGDFESIESFAFLHVAPAFSFVDPGFVAVPHHYPGVPLIAF